MGQGRPRFHQWESGLTCHGCAFSSSVGDNGYTGEGLNGVAHVPGLPWDSVGPEALHPDLALRGWEAPPPP